MDKNSTKVCFYSRKFSDSLVDTQRLKIISSFLKNRKISRILDIGCGDGATAVFWENYTEEIYGIDISQEAINLAIRKGIKGYRVDIDNEKLPFPDNYFDFIFCGEVIEHLFDPDRLLDEIYRILAYKGICMLTTPNLSSWFNRIALFFGYQPYLTEVSLKYNVGKFLVKTNDISGHLRAFTLKALRELCNIHHFKIIKIYGLTIFQSLIFPLNILDFLFSRIPSLAMYTVLVLKKI